MDYELTDIDRKWIDAREAPRMSKGGQCVRFFSKSDDKPALGMQPVFLADKFNLHIDQISYHREGTTHCLTVLFSARGTCADCGGTTAMNDYLCDKCRG